MVRFLLILKRIQFNIVCKKAKKKNKIDSLKWIGALMIGWHVLTFVKFVWYFFFTNITYTKANLFPKFDFYVKLI